VNSSIAKVVRTMLEDLSASNVMLLVLGERRRAILHRTYGEKFTMALVDRSKMVVPTFGHAMAFASVFLQHQFSEAVFIGNKFRSAISFKTTVTVFPSVEKPMTNLSFFVEYEIEGNETALLQNLAEFTAATEIYHYFRESNTTEQAQMSASTSLPS
jgi:F0F1-type ATP synthase gamma subunit